MLISMSRTKDYKCALLISDIDLFLGRLGSGCKAMGSSANFCTK